MIIVDNSHAFIRAHLSTDNMF